MKRFALGLMLVLSMSISAQEFGLRFGNIPVSNESNNIAIDGVFSAGDFSRIHTDISFGDGVGIDVLWDFLYRPLGEEEFNWYVGVGPSFFISDDFWFGASGEIGIEYAFKGVPIVLGIDWRPTFWFFDNTTFEVGGFGLNVRWRFN